MRIASPVSDHRERICIWGSRCLFAGNLPDIALGRRAAATICIGLDQEFEISLNGEDWMTFRTVLIPPMMIHAIRFSGKSCIMIFMDLSSTNYKSLRASNAHKTDDGIIIGLREEEQLIDMIRQVLRADSDMDLIELLNQIPPLSKSPVRGIDDRIQKIVEMIMAKPNEDHSAKDLAKFAGMSLSNMEHQFKKEIGIPFHSFRTWFRIKLTVYSLLHGMSHTEAALRAGFFDSAHFTRTFRATFGLPPSDIFKNTRPLKSFVEVPADYAENLMRAYG
jgi:AraC-like DNA-binding protein